ncbi:hypothetical protein BDW59DRAFT_160338 [Aspergillus cavernicola]|uniref:Uncharacterized protein n=1 Tax=Aspergillus cavernicola TaxID=176166 RepID=A0ABR4IHY7_9EURO
MVVSGSTDNTVRIWNIEDIFTGYHYDNETSTTLIEYKISNFTVNGDVKPGTYDVTANDFADNVSLGNDSGNLKDWLTIEVDEGERRGSVLL